MATSQISSVVQFVRRLLHQNDGMTDGQLLECYLARRDDTAFEALVRRHGPMVYGVCRRVLGDTPETEDAFQATFLVLHRKAASLRQPELVGNWLYGTAYRAALEAKAATAGWRARERQVREMPEREATTEMDVWHDLRPVLDQELNRLPDKYRVPVVLCELEGKKRKEVARQLRIPEGTLSSRLATARRILAKRLARHRLTVSGGALALALSQQAVSACVPDGLVVSTVRTATQIAVGSVATSGAISAKVVAITEGVMKTMFVIKLQRAFLFSFVLGVLLVGGVASYRGLAAEPTATEQGGLSQPAQAAETVGEVRRFDGHTDWVYTVALSPDGRRALSGSSSEADNDGVVRLWDVDTGKEVRRLEGHTAGIMAVAFSPDGKRAVSASDDKSVRLWDLGAGKELKRFEGHTEQAWGVAFSPDGKQIASCGQDKTVRLWDVETGQEVKSFEGHTEAVRTVVFSPDGKRLLTGAFDATVRLWDVEGGKEIRTFEGHTDALQCVAFSRDGRRALSCGLDRTIRLWNVEGGNKHCVFTGHTGAVTAVAFSADGRRMLSCSWDQTVRLWDVESGEVLHSFAGHEAEVQSAVFSPDGRHALSGSRDKTLRLWRLPK